MVLTQRKKYGARRDLSESRLQKREKKAITIMRAHFSHKMMIFPGDIYAVICLDSERLGRT